jgi:flavin reductase
LRDAIASLDCRVESVAEKHTHSVFFCAVETINVSKAAQGLIYFGRRYHSVGDEPASA